MSKQEGYKGIGRRMRRWMLQRWKAEGHGMSLKQWARLALTGDAALSWLEHKKAKR